VSLREGADRTADAVAFDARLSAAIVDADRAAIAAFVNEALERYDDVARITVEGPSGESWAGAERADRLDEGVYRHLRLARSSIGAPNVRIEVTVAAEAAPFVAYQRAGEVAEVYSRLEAGSAEVSGAYLAVYMGFLLTVMVVAVAVGVVASRRVTGRVADLAAATERVGAGDLTVSVPTHTSDEIGELTLAFNAMVADLRQSRDRIEYLQRIGAWQDFARRLAHEIKNPLTPIQLAAQEIDRAYKGDDAAYGAKLKEARAIIEEEVATLRRLVGEFSEFAKLPRAELSASDLGEFIGELSRSLPAALELPEGVSIRFETSTEPLPVRIDAMMLKRCVDNLVRNAVEAMGVGPGEVRVRTRSEGRKALIEVVDDGPGVSAEDAMRIFDPYFTTKSEGTGLGLAIVKKVVLEHGGTVGVRPAEKEGAIFHISLPLAPNSQ
jgi:nitrogen fixation/metabolism regulation signal transduction histidine kinase